MSKHNRANRDRYMQAGRLTPDEMARERMKQNKSGSSTNEKEMPRERATNRAPSEPGRGERASESRRSEREESD
jgi:hypothetical protein